MKNFVNDTIIRKINSQLSQVVMIPTHFDNYVIVQLNGLELRHRRRFERHRAYKMFQELKLVFHTHARVERYETSDITLPTRWRRIAQLVSMCSDCLGTTIT